MKRTWPNEFMWGTGTSSIQCEGAAPRSDWIEWERAVNAPASINGNRFGTRYAEDFALLSKLGRQQSSHILDTVGRPATMISMNIELRWSRSDRTTRPAGLI